MGDEIGVKVPITMLLKEGWSHHMDSILKVLEPMGPWEKSLIRRGQLSDLILGR